MFGSMAAAIAHTVAAQARSMEALTNIRSLDNGLFGGVLDKTKRVLSSLRAKLQAETGEWLRDIKASTTSVRYELQSETNEWLKEIK